MHKGETISGFSVDGRVSGGQQYEGNKTEKVVILEGFLGFWTFFFYSLL